MLVKRKRPITGNMRTILDLSEMMREQLQGETTCWDNDAQLRKKIAGSQCVGYAVTDKGGRHEDRIGLVSVGKRRAPKTSNPDGRRRIIERTEQAKRYG